MSKIKTALAVISGRYHPSRMQVESLSALGFSLNMYGGWPSDDEVLERCEEIVYKLLKSAATNEVCELWWED